MYYGERLNSITHLVGAVLALVGLGALLTVGVQEREPRLVISFSIFGFTLVLLYTMSTLYHSFPSSKVKRIFQKLDHLAIYLLIAGTYTPYMLVSLYDGNGLYMLASVWGLAALGIVSEFQREKRLEVFQISIYLIMGWICTFEYSNLKSAMPEVGFWWLNFGGVAYTVGVLFYILDNLKRLKHSHGIWHLFVLVGSMSHFISIIGYVR